MSTFSDRLKLTIEKRGTTQRWVAEQAGVRESTISRYISEQNAPAILDILAGICKALNVSSDYLIGLTNIPTKTETGESEEVLRLVRCFERMLPEDKAVLWALCNKYLTEKR